MFSHILECPKCAHRFRHESTQGFPALIICPECKEASPGQDFSAVVICAECRTKIKVPLDMLDETDLACPQCGSALMLNDDPMRTAATGEHTFDGASDRNAFRRILKDGEVFDKYRIIRLLGHGGMAEVYLAEHLLLKQKCALKLMRSSASGNDEIFVKRFVREAKLSHSLEHPNIVRVYDAGSDYKSGNLFIAMEIGRAHV